MVRERARRTSHSQHAIIYLLRQTNRVHEMVKQSPWSQTESQAPIHVQDGMCYSLDVECSSKVHMLKTWSPEWNYWEVLKTLGGGAS
jgi:hypothetical protein